MYYMVEFKGKEKIAVTANNTSLTKLDRLAEESAKLNPFFENQLSEEGFEADMESWPEY